MSWPKRILLGLATLLAIAAGAAGLYASQALPVTQGTLPVAGVKANIVIERDAHGIPTIRARSPQDAWFGLGFVHAQDRLWQLETHKRIAAGRLAEAFGPSALETDRFLRALGVRASAERQWGQASLELREMLEAYTAGINAYLADHLRARPPEFVLLGLQPEPWTPVDSIGWTGMMAWDLGGNWQAELLRMRLAASMPTARIRQLLPPYPGEEPLETQDYAALYKALGVYGPEVVPPRTAQATLPFDPLAANVEGTGSNNWAVAGKRSVTGRPLLANDPHLKLGSPALWYLARLEAPGLHVAGATMPGLPIVVLGQNRDIAWGFTNTAPDVQDLYIERIDQSQPSRYETPDGWNDFETREETIRVKGQGDVSFTARRTRHGPVISDAQTPATAGLTGQGATRYALALRWTALDDDAAASSLEAGLAFNRATSVAGFVAASRKNVAPMQNMLVADAERIALVSAGRVPLRSPDNDLKGLAPAPGWLARYGWTGFVPATETPRELDPARGWLASANQRVHGPEYPHFLTSEWTLPYRQQRIEQLLTARPLHSLDSFATMQSDVLSLATLRLLPYAQAARPDHALAEAAQRRLKAFDGSMTADGAAPLIFSAWVRHLTRRVFEDDLGPDLFARQLGSRSFRDALERVVERDDRSWCDDQRTRPIETCSSRADAALTDALDELQARQGRDVAQWRWGEAHQARAEHRPFSRVPALARFFELRVPVGGDAFTINAARPTLWPDGTTGEVDLNEHGPSFRALYDLNDRRRSRLVVSSGQSGLPFSRHHADQMRRWARGAYVPAWSDGGDEERLTLVAKSRP
ncbi:MAG TPA: penicillin acylase family protein [Methylibium sp.]|uniref:penicillin acylase family protein n=1 Tax=Methylibium sp. TaxID=2067992 RepID=UPI002DBC7CA3|nr:penicillin acylase family protein [Methylibium sp.]HEU4460622.1 penicillin acylase family protein [Methylibium sp.]